MTPNVVSSGVVLAVDIGTFYVSAAVVSGFFGCAFIAFHVLDRSTSGTLPWGIAYLLVTGGLVLTLYEPVLPLLIHGPVAHAMFILAVVLLDAGTRRETRSVPAWFGVGLPAAAFVLGLFFSYAIPSAPARLEVLLVGIAAGTGMTAARLMRRSREAEEGLHTALFTFAVFYTVLALSVVILAIAAPLVGPIHSLLAPHPIHAVLLPALMLFLIGAGMSKLWVHYMRAYAEARYAATVDPLTGVKNRRYVMPEFERLFQRAQREDRVLACMMLDADAFKSINDSYGHRKGDEVLQLLAQRITAVVREYDLVGRYGGEEFIIVVSDLGREDVVGMADRIHQSVRETPASGLRLTISLGVAFLSSEDERADDLIQRADRALYRAKRAGRDQVVVDEYEPELSRRSGPTV